MTEASNEPRESFLKRQAALLAREFSNLLEDERGEREAFLGLVADTYDEIEPQRDRKAGRRSLFPCRPFPESAFFPLRQPGVPELSQPLQARWRAWIDSYNALLQRSPRLELARHLQTISESHTASSWPDGYEGSLLDWVDGPEGTAPPFDDRHGIATPTFRQRLRDLRQQIEGWLFFDDDRKRVVYLPEAESQRRKEEQASFRVAARQAAQEARDLYARAGVRTSEVVAEARADTAFWQALLAWERRAAASEVAAQRPKIPGPKVAKPVDPMRQFQIRQFSKAEIAEKQRRDDAAIDPFFHAFLERVHRADDVLPRDTIVVTLRYAARRELGIDAPIVRVRRRNGDPVQ